MTRDKTPSSRTIQLLNEGLRHHRALNLVEAERLYRQVLADDPDQGDALHLLGTLANQVGQSLTGAALIARAVAVAGEIPAFLMNLGGALRNAGRAEESMAVLGRLLALAPDDLDARSNLLLTAHASPMVNPADLLAEAKLFGERVKRPARRRTGRVESPVQPPRRPRIGYVSGDFREHAVSYFLASVLEARDRDASEVFCYANSRAVDGMTERLRASVDQWRVIADLDDGAAADLVERDGIDVLVDLSGHTGGNRLPLFALKPAPVQVTWIGYSGTTGLGEMDYILADRIVAPPGDERYYSETIWRLPDSYLCFTPPDAAPSSGPSPTAPPLLGSLNGWSKIGDGPIELWSEILAALPEARLLLRNYTLNDEAARRDAIDRFQRRGVAPERLILEPSVSRAAMLEAYHRVDVALDSFPYGGTTTTAEALWMGVPVVTLAGDRWVGRVGESFLTSLGHGELIARSWDEYARVVIDLVRDRPRLTALRRRLAAAMPTSPLCDAARFSRALDSAFRAMLARAR